MSSESGIQRQIAHLAHRISTRKKAIANGLTSKEIVQLSIRSP